MDTDTSTRTTWNIRVMGVVLFLAVFAQSIFLPCLCRAGNAKFAGAVFVDILVLCRMLYAMKTKEQSKGWWFYAALPWVIIPILELVFQH